MSNDFLKKTISPDWLQHPNIKKIVEALSINHSKTIFFVGGCVRDSLLNLTVKDIDIGVPYPPDKTVCYLKSAGIKSIPTGIKHGTITAIIDEHIFEITSFRSDIDTDGRHAEVSYTDQWQEDAKRRDLTINGLYMGHKGHVYDMVGGIDDLQQGIIRFIGNPQKRIQEDYLRILRYFRFYARYGKQDISDDTADAILKEKHGLASLSKERVREEVFKLLAEGQTEKSFIEMNKLGIFEEIGFPEHCSFELFTEISKISNIDILTKFLALAYENKVDAKLLYRHMQFSNQEKKVLEKILTMQLYQSPNTPVWLKERYIHSDQIVKYLFLLSWAAQPKLDWQKEYDQLFAQDLPILPINGHDIQAFGTQDGKEIGKLLETAESYWLEHNFTPTKKEILLFLDQFI